MKPPIHPNCTCETVPEDEKVMKEFVTEIKVGLGLDDRVLPGDVDRETRVLSAIMRFVNKGGDPGDPRISPLLKKVQGIRQRQTLREMFRRSEILDDAQRRAREAMAKQEDEAIMRALQAAVAKATMKKTRKTK